MPHSQPLQKILHTLTSRASRNFDRSPDNQPRQSHYRPLFEQQKEIRLLVIEPGIFGEVRGSFIYVSLLQQPHPRYETVSYTWGDKSVRGSIILAGDHLDIPKSAENALRGLRFFDTSRCLWIDAICINQDDIAEKNNQVALMAEIYSGTTLNLIYLGPAKLKEAKAADHNIALLLADIKTATNEYKDWGPLLYPNGSWVYSDTGVSSTVDWDAIKLYYSNPWFKRLWVVQEAALATKSVCFWGRSVQPLDDILRIATWMEFKSVHVPRDVVKTTQAAGSMALFADHEIGGWELSQIYLGKRLSINLLLLMIALGNFLVTDSRDRIFALLGLYLKYSKTTELPAELVPNYSIPPLQLFQNAILYDISKTGRLDVLYHQLRKPPNHDNEDWPSWVCRSHPNPRDDTSYSDADDVILNADLKQPPHLPMLKYNIHWGELTVRGFFLGTVKSLTDTMETDKTVLKKMLEDVDVMENQAPSHWTAKPHRLLETVTGSRDHALKVILPDRNAELYQDFRRSILELNTLPCAVHEIDGSTTPAMKNAAYFATALYRLCWGRRIFMTSEGYLGRGPAAMQQGDVVAILYGCCTPLVLRPVEGKNEVYTLVQYCWVYGVMDGEAVRRHRLFGDEDVIIRLS